MSVGPRPTRTITDSDPGTVPSNPPTTTTVTKKTYTYFNGISGNAYEQIHEQTGVAINYNDNPGIPYVKVQAGPCITYTDASGNYSFNGLPAGNYNLTFTYGQYQNGDNDTKVKSKLKYNGLDYTAAAAGSASQKETIMDRTVKYKGKSATEIIIALDCSSSTRETQLEDGRTRFQTQIDAAKDLIDSLLEEDDIYISLVFFSGPSAAWRAISTTNNKSALFETIEYVKDNMESGRFILADGTDISNALNKCKDSFVKNADTNRWIVLLSDGTPTSDATTKIYSDDTDEELIRKLYKIVDNARKKMISLLDKGVNICSYIIESDDSLEQDAVNRLFGNIDPKYKGYKYFKSTDEDIIKTMKEDILRFIVDNKVIEEKVEVRDGDEVITEFDGVEDTSRREYVNRVNAEYNYQKSNDIYELLNNYDYTMKDKAKEFLNNSYMTVTVSSPYEIDNLAGEDDENFYMASGKVLSKEEYAGVYGTKYTGQNLELRKREQVDVDLEVKVTGYRLLLSNGAIYNQTVTDRTIDKDLDKSTIIQDIKDIGDSIYVESIKPELMYGSRVEIEYTVVLKNLSSVPIHNATIISYLTDIEQDDVPLLNFNENARMLSSRYTNAQYGWEIVKKEDLRDKVSADTYGKMKNDYYIVLNTATSNALRNEQQIGASGERYIKLVLTKTLSSKVEDDCTDFSMSAEVLSYKNNAGIRMMKTVTLDDNSTTKMDIIPGNSSEGLTRTVSGSSVMIKETDFNQSMRVIILPPTGKSTNNVATVILCIEVLLIGLIKKLKKI